MKILTKCSLFVVTSFVLFNVLAQQGNQTTTTASYECTQLSIEQVDETLLTKAERLALMDQNLQTSIDRYESCIALVQKESAAGGGGGGAGAEGSGGGNGAEGSESAESGSSANDSQPDAETKQSGDPSVASTNTQPVGGTQQQTSAKRGVVAPKDNDSIICKLLWEEIQTAPANKLAGFEKQYKDYKCG